MEIQTTERGPQASHLHRRAHGPSPPAARATARETSRHTAARVSTCLLNTQAYLERFIGGACAVVEELGAVDVDDLVRSSVHDQHRQGE